MEHVSGHDNVPYMEMGRLVNLSDGSQPKAEDTDNEFKKKYGNAATIWDVSAGAYMG